MNGRGLRMSCAGSRNTNRQGKTTQTFFPQTGAPCPQSNSNQYHTPIKRLQPASHWCKLQSNFIDARTSSNAYAGLSGKFPLTLDKWLSNNLSRTLTQNLQIAKPIKVIVTSSVNELKRGIWIFGWPANVMEWFSANKTLSYGSTEGVCVYRTLWITSLPLTDAEPAAGNVLPISRLTYSL